MRSILTRASRDSSAEIDFVYLTGEKFAPRYKKNSKQARPCATKNGRGGTISQARVDRGEITLARARRRFFRSADRRAADPSAGAVSVFRRLLKMDPEFV
jgi:hypothetical protein